MNSGCTDNNRIRPADLRACFQATSTPPTLRPQFDGPAHFKCEITTGTRACLPTRYASSIASRIASNSVRMCVVYSAPALAKRLRQRHHFFRRRAECRAIGQTAAQPKRAMRQRLFQLRAHAIDFLRRRPAIQPVHMVVAQRRVPDQRAHVHRRTRLIHGIDISREGRILKVVAARRAGSSDRADRPSTSPATR